MKYKIKFMLLLFATSTVFFSACNKTELVEPAGVNKLTPSQNEKSLSEASPSANALSMPVLNVQKGMLVFKSNEEYALSMSILANMAEEELVSFENKIGFTSLHTAYGNLYNLIETGIDSSDLYLFAQKNPKFFEITKNADGEDELSEINGDPVFQRICDASGMFLKENKAYRVMRKSLISTDLSHIAELKSITMEQLASKSIDLSLYTVTDLFGNAENSKEDKVGEYDEATALKDLKWCSDDRKVVVELKAQRDWYPDRAQSSSFASFKVYGKRKIACVWTRYKTHLTATDVWFNYGVYQKDANGIEVMKQYHYSNGNQGANFSVEAREILVVTDEVVSWGKVQPAFLQNYSCHVTSRGVDGKYADLPNNKRNLNEY